MADLIERLRAHMGLANMQEVLADANKAADLIEALTAKVAVMGEALASVKKAADPIAIAVNRAVNGGPNGKVILSQAEAMSLLSAVNRLAAAKESS